MQNACWHLPGRGNRSLRCRIPSHLEADALERPLGEAHDVLSPEERVEIDRALGGRLLEERIGVVPGAEIGDGAAEALGEPGVERALPARERRRRRAVGVGERLQELLLVQLVGREREREPVAVPERARRLVAEARKLANVVGDRCADRLRRLPGFPPLGLVVAFPQDALDLVVVDLAARERPRDGGRSGPRPRPRAR